MPNSVAEDLHAGGAYNSFMSETPTADEIRAAREARGWDQAELARLIDVGQQTVSRWERGETAPGGERLSRLRAALGVDSSATPPRRPLLDELPFNRLDAYQFEAFCEALASYMYSEAREVLRYGVSGDTQHGIDIRVVKSDGERIGIQCKKYAKFHPASLTKAAAELDLAEARVDRCVLFLSTRASASVIDACDKLDGWTVFDSRVLSRLVRELPVDRATALVRHHFPDMQEEFLGAQPAPGPWQTTEEAFPEFPSSPALSHRFRLLGRDFVLGELTAFVNGDRDPRVAVVAGPVGQGKSRLLREAARVHDRGLRAATRVLQPGSINADAFSRLPTDEHLLVLIEDAHARHDDLALVVAGILEERPRARVVITTRPYGSALVRGALCTAGMDASLVPWWDLSALPPDAAYTLACEVLGAGQERAARVVADVMGESPSLLLTAAIGIRQGTLRLRDVHTDADMRRTMLDVLLGPLAKDASHAADDRALLQAVAALQPVVTDVPQFQNALAGILGMPFTRISPRLLRLEETGVLVRRGSVLQIFPGSLGDALLAEAAVNPHDGSSTEYMQYVKDSAQGNALANALVNAGRIDWQWRSRRTWRGTAVDPLWAIFEAEFQQGSASTRAGLLPVLAKVAPFQSKRVIALLLWALVNPPAEDDVLSTVGRPPGDHGQAHVIRQIPRVLEAAASDVDQLRTVYDLLWRMGRGDDRPLHQHPEAPLRVLLDLASYAPGKPLVYQEVLLEALPDWLEDAEPRPANRMPLALLDPLFADIAEGRTVNEGTLTLSRHPLRADAVAPVRERATEILLGQYTSGNEAMAVAAARTIEEILRLQNESFESYDIALLHALRRCVTASPPSPFVSLATRRSLHGAIRYGSRHISEAARQVVCALPDEMEHRLAQLVFSHKYDVRTMPWRDEAEGLEEVRLYWQTARKDMLDELRNHRADHVASVLVSTAVTGATVLGEQAAGIRDLLPEALADIPSLPPALRDRLALAPEQANGMLLPGVLCALFLQDAPGTLETCHRLVAEGTPAEALAVSEALRTVARESSTQAPAVLELARALAERPDPRVRTGVLDAAVALLPTAKDAALGLLTSVPFGNGGPALHSLLRAFTAGGPLSWRSLSGPRRAHFLTQLALLPALDEYEVQQFVAHIADADVEAAAGLLRARVERWEASPDAHYRPLPFAWHVPLAFPASPARLGLLRSAREWLAVPRDRPGRRELHAPDLFWTLAGAADESVLSLLLEPYRSGDADTALASVWVLSKLPKDVVWDRPEFVRVLLHTAQGLSEDLYDGVVRSRHAAVFSGVRRRSLNEPYPEDVEIQARAERIRDELRIGSAADRFYSVLQDSATRNINEAVAADLGKDS
jgi:transcriptional regulator with XRE-family HTH domain